MDGLNDIFIDPGPLTYTQAGVLGVMLLLLIFAIWRARRVSPGPAMAFSDNPLLNAVGWVGLLLALPGAVLFLTALYELLRLTLSFPDAGDEAALRRHATLMLSLLAAIGALVGLVFGVIRVFAVERQTRAQEEGLITDRTNKAIEQLGHASPAVRMGAILQLERILRDSLEDRVLVLETLNAYVKHHQQQSPGRKTAVTYTPIDVQAALDVLIRHTNKGS